MTKTLMSSNRCAAPVTPWHRMELAACLLLFAAAGLLAQPGPPLSVSVQPSVSGKGIDLHIRNESQREVVGAVIGIEYVDPATGKTVFRASGSFIKATEDKKLLSLHPGEETTIRTGPPKTTASGGQTEPRLSLDIVVFDDGTQWGPAKLTSSAQLANQIRAMKSNQ